MYVTSYYTEFQRADLHMQSRYDWRRWRENIVYTGQESHQIWSNWSPSTFNKDEDVRRNDNISVSERHVNTHIYIHTYIPTFQLAYKENKVPPDYGNFVSLRAMKLRNSWFDAKRVSRCSSWSNTFNFLDKMHYWIYDI